MRLLASAVHELPRDLARAIQQSPRMLKTWQDITPLARNEFICWVISAKLPATRARRIMVTKDKLERGERRPCCWIGCTHRTDKAISPSVQAIINRKSSE